MARNSTTTADELYKTPINWRKATKIVVPVAAGLAFTGWLGSKYIGGDVNETKTGEMIREPAPATLQLSEKEIPKAPLELPKASYPAGEIDNSLNKYASITDKELDRLMNRFDLEEGRKEEYGRAFDKMIGEMKKESGYKKHEIRKVFEQPPEITNSPVGNITAYVYSWHKSSRGNKWVWKWYLQYDDKSGSLLKLHTVAPKGTY